MIGPTIRAYPSRADAERLRHTLATTVAALREGPPPRTAPVWPAGLDRALLLDLPLDARVRDSFIETRLLHGHAPLTVADLLPVQNVGRPQIRVLVETLDQFLADCHATPKPTRATLTRLRVHRLVQSLTERERAIIEHRWRRRPPTPYRALAERFGVAAATIQQIAGRLDARVRAACGYPAPALYEQIRNAEIGRSLC